jgi:hypothetical protein
MKSLEYKMASLVSPIHIQKSSIKFLEKRKRSHRRLARPVRVQGALPNPDLVNYAQLQLVTWILPMTIAGRLLKVDYPDIAIGLTVMTIAKLSLAASGII